MHYTEVVVLETPYSVPNPGERGLNPSYEILRDYKSGGLINIKTGKRTVRMQVEIVVLPPG